MNASVQASYVDGKKYGFPISFETVCLFYNTDKFNQVPATWEELLEVSKDKGGIMFEATGIYYDLGFLRAFGGYIFNYNNGAYDVNDIGLGSENAIAAYHFINKLANEYHYIPSDVTYDLAKSSFQNGETAFYIGGPWDIQGFTEAGTPFDIAVMPTVNGKPFVTPVGTYVGFVSSKSGSQSEVWDFYKYLSENASQELYTTGNRLPANKKSQDAIKSDHYTAIQYRAGGKWRTLALRIGNGADMDTFLRQHEAYV